MRGLGCLVALFCVLLVAGCGEPPVEQRGYISSVTPDKATPGAVLIVRGQGLGAMGQVFLAGGKIATIRTWEPTVITVLLPEDLPAGPSSLEFRNDKGSLGSVSFTVVPPPPRIKSVDPDVGSVGDIVAISGSGFGDAQGKSSVTVYGTKVKEIKEWKSNRIAIVVPELPADPQGYTILVETDGGRSNERDFAAVKPYASVLVPEPALAGRPATIKGRDFGKEKGQVLIGPKKFPLEVLEWGETAIKVKLPDIVDIQSEIRIVNRNGSSIPLLATVLPRPVTGRIGNAPGDQVTIALDDVDLPYIFTMDSKSYKLYQTSWTVNGWDKQQIVVTLGKSTGTFPKVAPDLENKISAVLDKYRNKPGDAKANEAAMRAEIDDLTKEAQKAAAAIKTDALVAGLMPDLVIDASRRLHFTAYEAQNIKTLYGTKLLDDTDWQFEFVDAGQGVKCGLASAVAVDPRGAVHVAYMDGTTRQVKHAVRREGKFVTEVVDPEQDCGATVAIDVDKNGVPAIAYLDFGKFDLKAARVDGKAWKAERVDAQGWTGDMPALAFDDGGNPVVAYMVRSDDGNAAAGLKVAVYTGKGWVVETVDSGPGVGNQPQLKKDKLGRFHLAYFDGQEGSIKYAVRKGIVGAWDKQSMRLSALPAELKPKQMSLAIASDNTARIVYFTSDGFIEYRQFTPR